MNTPQYKVIEKKWIHNTKRICVKGPRGVIAICANRESAEQIAAAMNHLLHLSTHESK